MTSRSTAFSIGLLSAVALSTNAAAAERESRSVPAFESLVVAGSITLDVTQGPGSSVQVESAEGAVADVITEVRNGTLHVHQAGHWFPFFLGWGRRRDVVHVTMPRLVSVTASGGSHVSSQGRITGDTIDITASGGADLTLDVAVGSLHAHGSGGADLRLSGTAGTTRLSSSGGSDLDASRLTSESATVTGSGGADVWIGKSGTLVATASGGSDIAYDGEPRSLTVNSSGGGRVSRRSAGP